MKDFSKLIVALDLGDKRKIKNVVLKLAPLGVKFKVGFFAYIKFGPALVKEIIKSGAEVFLDLKLYDIPNTMCTAGAAITELGCWAFTVHIKAGHEALSAVRKEITLAAKKFKVKRPLILGVSELTSINAGVARVLKLVDIAAKAELDGVIASPWEAKEIKKKYNLKVVTPGIRPAGAGSDDQKRIATAQFAFSHGADYIVVGRQIIGSKDYALAAREILQR